MESLYLLIPISVLIVFVAIWIFLAMSDSGQFDDMLGPALNIIQDDDRAALPSSDETRPPRHPCNANTKAK
ncbi:cbb3-type cytochrome oxidase assembly protein CcoS [Undibacterium terreum]|uniref:cbb3-type cytochrome oxidase assembly protein CcoS n=1 Tax=Undibacterium terreum TaxID=1224302 RepID=UPI0016644D1F|nr:cbb3-type cytochrome oxidase assembly protein CcoS [Undibacterium terreum]